ncbi:ABC transporter substrate-binding protein [Brenneria corticis]|uniref:ABC transporter substrate-binding protein n=1 Tax=Brenneria corticis TaxID=2173106 RepID=A0A2U1TUM3_9GAMM|nr:ABC transporter substrate-binding protein [Brenneria sp. CFCC 11842]PWC13042.1 ABC transporter substrate-binding protein [Brenneria sp. CFCC 11842]
MFLPSFVRVAVAGVLVALGAAAPAQSAPRDNSVVVALTEELPGFDAYLSTAREGLVASRHIFDTLIERNLKNGAYEPSLAVAWKRIDPLTWEFTLRQGVVFHNGDPFSADDVVFTINRYIQPEAGARSPSWVSWIARAEKVDDFTVRVVSKAPYPAALEFLSGSVSIFPKNYYESVGQQAFGKKPIGTGPFRLASSRGNEYVLERNERYFSGAKSRPRVERVTVRVIPDEATRIAEAIGGGVDWTWNISTDQIKQLAAVPHLQSQFGSTLTIAAITLDARGRAREGKSPLSDVRVRQAIHHAIDRRKIVETLLGGDGQLLKTFCHPLQFGCAADQAVEYPYDPARARQLLAEAGYPDGFEVSLSSFRDKPRAEAVKAYLAAVGINARLEFLQSRASYSKWREGKLDLWYGDWGSAGIQDASAALSAFYSFTPQDGFRDAEIRDILKTADNSLDEAERIAAYGRAIRLASERAYIVPMHTIVVGYVSDKRLNYKPSPDGFPRFEELSWGDAEK